MAVGHSNPSLLEAARPPPIKVTGPFPRLNLGEIVCVREREREIMVLMGSRRLLLLFCLFTVVARRVAGQGAVARLLPCGVDNLSCPNTDQSILECYPFTQLCDTIEQCDGGSDEGTDLVALECECPFSRARKNNRAT